MIAPHAAPDVIVVGDTLPEIQQHRPRGIGVLHPLVIGYDFFRRDGRAVSFAIAERLRVVRLITVHPADDGGIIQMAER